MSIFIILAGMLPALYDVLTAARSKSRFVWTAIVLAIFAAGLFILHHNAISFLLCARCASGSIVIHRAGNRKAFYGKNTAKSARKALHLCAKNGILTIRLLFSVQVNICAAASGAMRKERKYERN